MTRETSKNSAAFAKINVFTTDGKSVNCMQKSVSLCQILLLQCYEFVLQQLKEKKAFNRVEQKFSETLIVFQGIGITLRAYGSFCFCCCSVSTANRM